MSSSPGRTPGFVVNTRIGFEAGLEELPCGRGVPQRQFPRRSLRASLSGGVEPHAPTASARRLWEPTRAARFLLRLLCFSAPLRGKHVNDQ